MLAALDLTFIVPASVRVSQEYHWAVDNLRPLLPEWLHAFGFITAIASVAAASRIRVRRRGLLALAFASLMLLQAYVVMTQTMLDGGVHIYNTSALWAWIPMLAGTLVLYLRRRYGTVVLVLEEPVDAMRRRRRQRKATHEIRMR